MATEHVSAWSPTPNKPWEDDWRKRRLMDWLLTPPPEREPRSKTALAAEFKVSVRTLENWSDQPEFKASWERRANDIVGNPERAHRVLDALYGTAIDTKHKSHVAAAKLYLDFTKSMRPAPGQAPVVQPGELTDEELDELLASAESDPS